MTILVKPFEALQFIDVKISTGQFWVICSELVNRGHGHLFGNRDNPKNLQSFTLAKTKLPFLPLYRIRKRTFRFSFNLLLHSFEQVKYGWNDQLQLPYCFCRLEGNLPKLLHEAFGGDGASSHNTHHAHVHQCAIFFFLSLTSCLGNPCVPPFMKSQRELTLAQKKSFTLLKCAVGWTRLTRLCSLPILPWEIPKVVTPRSTFLV